MVHGAQTTGLNQGKVQLSPVLAQRSTFHWLTASPRDGRPSLENRAISPQVALENKGWLKKHLPSLSDIHNVPPLCQHDKLGDRFKNVLTL